MYAEYDITKLIEDAGISINLLMPSSDIKLKVTPGAKYLDADCDPFLPLEAFDDMEYDCRTPNEWLQLGREADGQRPVPGRALLANGLVKDGVKQHEWKDVGMIAYNARRQLYQVICLTAFHGPVALRIISLSHMNGYSYKVDE